MSSSLHPRLERLEKLANHLAHDVNVRAVLGLGSAGVEHDRFDDHSDIDFFVIVADRRTKQRYLTDLGWLDAFDGKVTYHYANDPNSHKALFADGLFLELAVFTPTELAALPLSGERVVWQASDFDLPPVTAPPAATALDTVGFHLNECLTNLYIGLRRELRGETLTAMRFIQVYAIDRVIALIRLHPDTTLQQPDSFEPTRRLERATALHPPPLATMITGYRDNVGAAEATLGWLTAHYDTRPAIVTEIEALLQRCRLRSADDGGAEAGGAAVVG